MQTKMFLELNIELSIDRNITKDFSISQLPAVIIFSSKGNFFYHFYLSQ